MGTTIMEPIIGTEILRALGDLGPWGAAGLFVIWQMRTQKKNGNGVDMGKLVAVQEQQTQLIEHIENDGSVKFQRYEGEMKGWKREREGFEDRHGTRLDDAHRRIETQKERLDKMLTEHKIHHPESTVI